MKKYLGVIAGVVTLLGVTVAAPADAAVKPKHYVNCTALNKVYRHGVGKTGARDKVSGHTKRVTNFTRNVKVYNLNKGLDRDHDGIACEKR